MSPDPGVKADLHRYHKLSPTFPNEKGGCTILPKKGSIIETCTTFKTPVAKGEWGLYQGCPPLMCLIVTEQAG